MQISYKFKYIHDNALFTLLLTPSPKLSANAIKMKYPIYRNKRLNIDDVNVPLEAMPLGSK